MTKLLKLTALTLLVAVCLWQPSSAQQPTNVARMNNVTVLMGAGNTGTGSQRVTEATDSQLSAGVGATSDSAATAGSTGSMNAKLRLMTSLLDTINTNIAAGTASNSGNSYISVGSSEDEFQVKGSAGVIANLAATNNDASADAYLKCADGVSGGVTPGSTTPTFRALLPHGGGLVQMTIERAFTTGWTCWIVTGPADNDATEVGANDVMVNYDYR